MFSAPQVSIYAEDVVRSVDFYRGFAPGVGDDAGGRRLGRHGRGVEPPPDLAEFTSHLVREAAVIVEDLLPDRPVRIALLAHLQRRGQHDEHDRARKDAGDHEGQHLTVRDHVIDDGHESGLGEVVGQTAQVPGAKQQLALSLVRRLRDGAYPSGDDQLVHVVAVEPRSARERSGHETRDRGLASSWHARDDQAARLGIRLAHVDHAAHTARSAGDSTPEYRWGLSPCRSTPLSAQRPWLPGIRARTPRVRHH